MNMNFEYWWSDYSQKKHNTREKIFTILTLSAQIAYTLSWDQIQTAAVTKEYATSQRSKFKFCGSETVSSSSSAEPQ
jgi:hypothetical protein